MENQYDENSKNTTFTQSTYNCNAGLGFFIALPGVTIYSITGSKIDGHNVSKKALEVLTKLKEIDLIVDDTEDNISAKIKKFNLIGIPYQIILGSKTPDDSVEFREVGGESQIIKINNLDKIERIIRDKRN